jgi:hypothetical protein
MCNKVVLEANFLPDANVTEMLLHAARLSGHFTGPLITALPALGGYCLSPTCLYLNFFRIYSEID